MTYTVAEKFKSIQGEGLYAGTPMAFIRFTGCSVGKKICTHCDTDFDKTFPWRGGGEFTPERLLTDWAHPYTHVCLTGGEPLDQELWPLVLEAKKHAETMFHLETSGTKLLPDWITEYRRWSLEKPFENVNAANPIFWVCVSPKPGFLENVVMGADEVKVIVPGLGDDKTLEQLRGIKDITAGGLTAMLRHPLADRNDFRWPTLQDALRWAKAGKLVYLQPRNGKFDIDSQNLRYVQDLLVDYPQLRLSTQMHKILKVQ